MKKVIDEKVKELQDRYLNNLSDQDYHDVLVYFEKCLYEMLEIGVRQGEKILEVPEELR